MGEQIPRRTARKRFDFPSIVALLGLFALLAAVHFYEPLDHDYFYIVGLVMFFLPFGFQIYLNRRTRKGEAAGNLTQFCKLLFFAPLLVAAIVGINGGLDHSLPEQRSSIIVRKWPDMSAIEMTAEEIWRAIRDLDPEQRRNASDVACVIAIVVACVVWY